MLIFCFIASVKKSLQKRRVVIDKEEQGMYRSINDNNKIEVSSIVFIGIGRFRQQQQQHQRLPSDLLSIPDNRHNSCHILLKLISDSFKKSPTGNSCFIV